MSRRQPDVKPAPFGAPLSRNLVIAITLTVLVLGLLVAMTWRRESYQALGMLRGRTIVGSLALVAGSWVFDAARAWLVVRAMGHPVPFRVAFRAVMAGSYLAGITPFMGGGGPLEALVLSQGGVPYAQALASVTASGLVAQGVLLIVSVALAFSGMPLPGLPVLKVALRWVLGVYALGLVAVASALMQLEVMAGPLDRLLGRLEKVMPHMAARLTSMRRKSRSFLSSAASGIRTVLAGRPAVVGALAVLYVGYYLLIFLVAPLIGKPMGLALPVEVVVGAQFPLFLLTAVVPTPGASGGVEAAMAALVGPHLPLGAVGIFVTAWRVLTLYPSMALGAVATVVSLRQARPVEDGPDRVRSLA